MAIPTGAVEKIRALSESCRKLEEKDSTSEAAGSQDRDEYTRQLGSTLSGLQEPVARQDAVLQELRSSRSLDLPRPDLDPVARLAQIRRATEAYKSLSAAEPELPAADSPLGSLLALRETNRLLNELRTSISVIARDLTLERERLKGEEKNLRDSKVIGDGFRARIERLKSQQLESTTAARKVDQKKVAKETMQQLRRGHSEMEADTKKMKEALKTFIDERLAAMLAAEDLGGPVVGDQLEISDATLEAGYTAHGKERKPRTNTETELDSRQQRIEQYLERDGQRLLNRRETAGAEMHELIDKLLQVASTSSSYVELERDSAASRFLVKAKIAQYHPRDSRRMRLIDVAREID